MNAKAFFFDAHGVLYYRPHGDACLESFLNELGIFSDVKAARVSVAHLHDLSMRNKVNLQEYHNALLQACGVRDLGLIEEGLIALRQDQANIALFDGVIETLKSLKARKIKLGIITDTAVTKLCKLTWLKSCGLCVVWDAYANSIDLGTRKPDPLMYKTALQQARITRFNSVFVGHASHELKGARQVGLTTVGFNPEPGAEADYFVESFSEILTLPLFRPA